MIDLNQHIYTSNFVKALAEKDIQMEQTYAGIRK